MPVEAARCHGFDRVILSCEHGGCAVPPAFRPLFAHWRGRLQTHHGYDRGALPVARRLAAVFGWPLTYSTTTRLLVDLNRPLDNPTLFSAVTASLLPARRAAILSRFYQPYWRRMDRQIAASVRRREKLLHISLHSFTPRLRGERRDCDFGLLFDPRSPLERRFCAAWQRALAKAGGGRYRVRRNYPYRGDAPALTTSMRAKYGSAYYAGIELEVNQKFARRPEALRAVIAVVAESLKHLCDNRDAPVSHF
jgi:predicted N-formylglutamate amidohydrolase